MAIIKVEMLKIPKWVDFTCVFIVENKLKIITK